MTEEEFKKTDEYKTTLNYAFEELRKSFIHLFNEIKELFKTKFIYGRNNFKNNKRL